jgi:hypothetical protein
VQRVCFAVVMLLGFVAAPAIALADPILATSNRSGAAAGALDTTALFPATTRAEATAGLAALDFSDAALTAVFFELPAGTDLPSATDPGHRRGAPPTPDAAMASMGPVIAYHVGSWDRFPSGYNFGLVGLIEPQISNVSFEYGKDASGPKFPIGPALSVPEPVTLLLLGPATVFALWRRRRVQSGR